MKKILTLVFALLLSIGVSAQTQLTEAVNFEATAHNGEEIELFDILDGGQYALIYFYYSSGPAPVKDYVAKIVDAYYSLGCNSEDIYFMEVSPQDHAKSTDEWISTYKVPFPTIHKETEGDTGDSIAAKYQIKGWPTTVLIAPDRKIVLQDIYPIASAEDLVKKLTTEFNIEEKPCADGQAPEVAITKTRVNMENGQGNILEASTKVHVDFRANAAVDKFYYTISKSAQLTSEDVIAEGTLAESKEFSHTFEGLTESTTYFVYAQPVGLNGENGAKAVIETKTLCPGDNGEVTFELTVQVSASHVVAKAVPSASTSDYHFGFTRKEYYDGGEENQFIFLNSLANDNYPFCDAETYELPIKKEDGTPTFFPNTPYYLVAVGRNGEGQWFAPTLYEFVVEQPVGPATVTLRAKPAATSVAITATPNEFTVEFHFGVVTKEDYDLMGAETLIKQIRNDGYPTYQATEATWDNLKPNTGYVALGSALNAGNEWGETAVEMFSTMPESLVETEASFNIYPNPAQSMINIESSLNGEAQVNIFDMTGRNVKQVSVADMSNVTINVENLNKGVYFISIQQDRNHNIQKLVIE